jgi:hypothetical protein
MSRKSELAMIARNFPGVVDRLAAAELEVNNGGNGMSSFFAMDTAPMPWRTKEITTKDGRTLKVPTARDIFK